VTDQAVSWPAEKSPATRPQRMVTKLGYNTLRAEVNVVYKCKRFQLR